MPGKDARHLLVAFVAYEIRHVLLEIAAERDVEHLRAAADGEDRRVALEGRREQGDLRAVALRADGLRLGCASAP